MSAQTSASFWKPSSFIISYSEYRMVISTGFVHNFDFAILKCSLIAFHLKRIVWYMLGHTRIAMKPLARMQITIDFVQLLLLTIDLIYFDWFRCMSITWFHFYGDVMHFHWWSLRFCFDFIIFYYLDSSTFIFVESDEVWFICYYCWYTFFMW